MRKKMRQKVLIDRKKEIDYQRQKVDRQLVELKQ